MRSAITATRVHHFLQGSHPVTNQRAHPVTNHPWKLHSSQVAQEGIAIEG